MSENSPNSANDLPSREGDLGLCRAVLSRLASINAKTHYLCVIALQALDLVSTFLAFETGRVTEQNELLIAFSAETGLSIELTVLLAKLVVISIFALAYQKSEQSKENKGLLMGVVFFYGYVCFMNFFWAFHFR